jgi:hypothetical protein
MFLGIRSPRALPTCTFTNSVRRALTAGIPAYLIDGEKAVPKPITLKDWRLANW